MKPKALGNKTREQMLGGVAGVAHLITGHEQTQ